MRVLAAVSLVLGCGACGSDDGAPVDRTRVFGGDRPVELQVPSTFDDARTYPLLVILHGYSATAFLQQSYFRLFDAPDLHDTLVLAPEGTRDTSGNQFWNASPACCDTGGTNVDDVAYLGGLLDDVAAAWPVDRARVTVLGHSNGAFMAYRLACERADVVTAIAGLAGHATGTTVACTPSRSVSVLHIHGTADETVPYESGTFGGVASPGAVDSVRAWAMRNQCSGARSDAGRKDLEATLPGDDTVVSITAGCPASGAADLWTIEGGSHIPQPSERFPAEIMTWLSAHRR